MKTETIYLAVEVPEGFKLRGTSANGKIAFHTPEFGDHDFRVLDCPPATQDGPVAWMKRGGKVFCDSAHIAKAHAERSRDNDKDAEVIPLYASAHVAKVEPMADSLGQKVKELLASARADEWDNSYFIDQVCKAADATDEHADDVAVSNFAHAMRAKMAKSRAKGRDGWNDKSRCDQSELNYMMAEHINKGDPVDVANFAMMLHQRGERITFTVPTQYQSAQPLPAPTQQEVASIPVKLKDWLLTDPSERGILGRTAWEQGYRMAWATAYEYSSARIEAAAPT